MIKKEWTLFFYMNGNNDLAPEIYNSFLALSNFNDKNINVIVQISLAKPMFVSIIRPLANYKPEKVIVNGLYLIKQNNQMLLKVIDNINMSSPSTLLNFVNWGFENYPAKKNAIFLGGHGYKNIGCMTDLVGKQAYIMGYEQIASGISFASKNSKSNINILFLDTCFVNDKKVLDLLEKYLDCYVIIPKNNAPIEGYDYNTLINVFNKNCFASLENIIKKILLNKDLIYYKLENNTTNNYVFDLIQLNHKEIYACICSANEGLTETNKKNIFNRLLKFNNWNK